MGRFEAKTYEGTGHLRVTLTGECDLAVRDELHAVLGAAVRASPLVIVDLGDLDFLDSSGVHGLVVAYHEAQARGGRITLVNPTGAVAAVLDLTGVGPLLSAPGDGRAGPAEEGRAGAVGDGRAGAAGDEQVRADG